ncbi:hypothetical protein B0T19DRAFT_415483 [Cercophora scortea]|uniref:Zn(2)-C6 fungal-type domain-containing protein n=1 Tax=Cercophora scortea TaxID=314031 RepID=A0AAE0IW89_9PEZI|nr:hypothetical protein B0T19DRAFT_415483 [Cercophora scortea]
MAPGLTTSTESCSPAPYGRACAGCSRAKCKCFYRSGSDGSECERCHRLGKTCEPSAAARVRKRKVRTPPPTSRRIEEKLDDLVSLLRSQAGEKQDAGQVPQQPQQYTPQTTPSAPDKLSPTLKTLVSFGDPLASAPTKTRDDPEIAIDTDSNVVHIFRSNSPGPRSFSLSPVYNDVSVHDVPDGTAEEQLATFRRVFLNMFPFVHLPPTMSASELRYEKPFLWLNIMALTTNRVAQQFAMGDTIWRIISQRVITEHLADLDLVLGLVCFAAWSHYFKNDKPFMTILSQVAVATAMELGIHNGGCKNLPHRSRSGWAVYRPNTTQDARTLEERRTMIAVFHVTSSTWTAYRKTEPLRWTPYLDSCLRMLSQGTETYMDIILATQVKCQIITDQLTCPSTDPSLGETGESIKRPSPFLISALRGQVNEIRQSIPEQLRGERILQYYLHSTELTIQETLFTKARLPDQTGLSQFRRIQDLDAIMRSVESWLTVMESMPMLDWPGVNVDVFAQFTHSLVVLFKLTTIDEPGWDTAEVRRRADVFTILDRLCDIIERIPATLGTVEAEGTSRMGLFAKTPHVLRAIKALFAAEMPPGSVVENSAMPQDVAMHTPESAEGGAGGVIVTADYHGNVEENTESFQQARDAVVINPDDFMVSLTDEPWLSDIFGSQWDMGVRPPEFLFAPYEVQ